MGVIFTNGFGVGIVPQNNVSSGQWYLATGPFGYQPAWTFGTITWPMNGDGGYGTNDPNIILSGDTAGLYINQFDAAGNDQSILLGSIVNNSGTIMFSQGSHYIIYGFTSGTFQNGGPYGSTYWGPGGSSSLTLIATSNTAFNGYSYGDSSMGGPLTYVDSGIAPNNSELVTITINTSPDQFTITTDSFDTNNSYGSVCSNAQGELINYTGITVSQASNLYCGVYAHISGDTVTQITNAYSSAGATASWDGYIFDVVWGPGSTVTNGVAKLAFIPGNSNQIEIIPIDTTDTNYLNNDNDASIGTSLVGTFNFPATFTFKTPLDLKGGWC